MGLEANQNRIDFTTDDYLKPSNLYSRTASYSRWRVSRLGMSVTTQGGSRGQYITGSRRYISKYRFVLLNVYRFRET